MLRNVGFVDELFASAQDSLLRALLLILKVSLVSWMSCLSRIFVLGIVPFVGYKKLQTPRKAMACIGVCVSLCLCGYIISQKRNFVNDKHGSYASKIAEY